MVSPIESKVDIYSSQLPNSFSPIVLDSIGKPAVKWIFDARIARERRIAPVLPISSAGCGFRLQSGALKTP